MRFAEFVHKHLVVGRRARRLSSHLADLIPRDSRILDVGCGDGRIAQLLMQMRPDLSVSGIDVLVREGTKIPVKPFDGQRMPYPKASFDIVMLVDVLHHAENPCGLIEEALRVSRKAVLIKDHTQEGLLAGPTLRFMDRVGNLRHGVHLRYDYWSRQRWVRTFESLGVTVTEWRQDLGLYPWPVKWVFERSLHFLACLTLE